MDEIDISPILLEDLREDASGSMIKEMSDLAYHAFREPPWNDDLEAPRLHFGLGVDLMRRSAKAWIAWSRPAVRKRSKGGSQSGVACQCISLAAIADLIIADGTAIGQ